VFAIQLFIRELKKYVDVKYIRGLMNHIFRCPIAEHHHDGNNNQLSLKS